MKSKLPLLDKTLHAALPLKALELMHGIELATSVCFNASLKAGWWSNLKTGKPLTRNKSEMLMLIVSEIAEAMEGVRKDKQDEHLPQFKSVEVELADALIRIFDFAGGNNYRIHEATVAKLAYNAIRADHKISNRKKLGGKKF